MGKVIAVLGATGSVGIQALDVVEARGYQVDFLSAGSNVKLASMLARKFKPKYFAMADETSARELSLELADTNISVLSGERGILEGIAMSSSEVVVNSILGEAGLKPTLSIIESGKRLALANKESLVIAGDIVMAAARANNVEILPVDSEHSAIFQSLLAGKPKEIKSIILTASGGPFFGKTKDELKGVTLADTLAHPTWKMGKKITVDSATLMNKGFEIIEAAHLFGVGAEKIKVVIHRESILHSAVEYIDNSIIGEFSAPDMRMCVQYAVDYPNREIAKSEPLDLIKIGKLTFSQPDTEAFPLLLLAKRAMMLGGGMGAVLNAADEVAVSAFLQEKIRFYQIPVLVEKIFSNMEYGKDCTSLNDIIELDRESRRKCLEAIEAI